MCSLALWLKSRTKWLKSIEVSLGLQRRKGTISTYTFGSLHECTDKQANPARKCGLLHLNPYFREIFKNYLLFFYYGIRHCAENFRRTTLTQFLYSSSQYKSKVKKYAVLPGVKHATIFLCFSNLHIFTTCANVNMEKSMTESVSRRREVKSEMTFSSYFTHTDSQHCNQLLRIHRGWCNPAQCPARLPLLPRWGDPGLGGLSKWPQATHLTSNEMQAQADPTQSPLLFSLHCSTEGTTRQSDLGPALKEFTSRSG